MKLNSQLLAAIRIALDAHGDQLDKAGMPYILHPLHVMDSVDGLEAKIVAVLHDVVEDTQVTLSDLYNNEVACFNKNIIDAVDAITKREGEKNKEYWARIKQNPLALRVKLADMEHNSSEERLSALSPDEANYLRSKYKRAKEYLSS